MNIIVLNTAPLSSYRDALVAALAAHGPYTDYKLIVICSAYEAEYNVETYDALSAVFDDVEMQAIKIPPYNAEEDELSLYVNKVMSNHLWRVKAVGETLYLPAGLVPAQDVWHKELRSLSRESGADFYGPVTGVAEDQWLNSFFVCDGTFLSSNPCLRGFNNKENFMFRARNYTNRSTVVADTKWVTAYDLSEGSFDPMPRSVDPSDADETKDSPLPKAKRVKKKTAKKKSAKKRAKKKAAKKPLPSVAEALKSLRADSE